MNVRSWSTTDHPSAAAGPGAAIAHATRLDFPVFLAIVTLFWLYATISAVLFAYGVNAGFSVSAGTAAEHVPFAPWQPRVAQYVLLYPFLLGFYWWSLRLGWLPLPRRIAQQLALAIVFALLARLALIVATELLDPKMVSQYANGMFDNPWKLRLELLITLATFTDFLVRYGFGLALVSGIALYKQYKDSELRGAAMERQWHAARLAALRMQLSPHTLFNLLHTIRGQIAWDPPAAQTMVVQLADLLRRLLNAGERDFSRLADEVEFVRLYLELQRRRFADRLTLSLPDATSLPAVWVPSLILQPLVENAVVHGLAGHDGAVRVSLTVQLSGDDLLLTVANTISTNPATRPDGIGLVNVRQRLDVQFGGRARLTFGATEPGVWTSEIRMPALRDLPAASASA